ncbi:MAG: exodeoxyribonuclease VII small subunit [Clostridia bacterium]|nr:exodeoxyribonuclease VII small subunit [Clostridia bacterium]
MDKEPTFEEALERLETIVRSLEEGKMTLEDSLKGFEEGIGLVRLCTRKLDEAEQKVTVLLQDGKEEQEFSV